MEKPNYAKKMKALGKKVGNKESPDPAPVIEQPRLSATEHNEKVGTRICPFRSAMTRTYCGPDCKLYRTQKEGHNCPMQEIYALSWKIEQIKKGVGQN